MAGEVTVNRPAMVTAANNTADAVSKIKGEQTRLSGYHSTLMAGWQGESANAFTTAYEHFNTDFTKVIQALDEMHSKLVTTHTNYNNVEATNTAQANRVNGLLNR